MNPFHILTSSHPVYLRSIFIPSPINAYIFQVVSSNQVILQKFCKNFSLTWKVEDMWIILTLGRDNECMQNLSGETFGKWLLVRPKRRLKNNVKMDRMEMAQDHVSPIREAHAAHHNVLHFITLTILGYVYTSQSSFTWLSMKVQDSRFCIKTKDWINEEPAGMQCRIRLWYFTIHIIHNTW